MTKVLIGAVDNNVISDLSSLLSEMDGYDVRAVARSIPELLDLTNRLEPDLVFIDEHLGVEPIGQTIRDLAARRPAMAILQISLVRTDAATIKAMEAGARGVVAFPFAYEEVSSRIMAATDWSIHMSGVLEGAAKSFAGRGRVIAVVGAKGGVGTTTVATHLAADHVELHPDERVCLVDIDLEKGDIGAILEVRQAVSIADVAKIAGDLSSTAVEDALVEHESGIHLLLAPLDVSEAEFVSAEALRSIIAMLRRTFSVIIIDGGGHVSPPQAAVVEIADEVVVVTTPDVLAMRGLRRRMIAWEALGVREEAAFKVLVNKTDKASIFPSSSVAKLTTAAVTETSIPYSPRVIEVAMNQRDPRAITEVAWWRLIRKLRVELGLEAEAEPRRGRAAEDAKGSRLRARAGKRGGPPREPATEQHEEPGRPATTAAGAPDRQVPSAPSGSERLGISPTETTRRAVRERGAIGIESAALIPVVILACLIAWQIAVIGFTAVYAGHSTTQAAREYAITGSVLEARRAATAALPSVLHGGLAVQASGNQVSVTLSVPAAAPGLPQSLTTTRSVVNER